MNINQFRFLSDSNNFNSIIYHPNNKYRIGWCFIILLAPICQQTRSCLKLEIASNLATTSLIEGTRSFFCYIQWIFAIFRNPLITSIK